LVIRVSPQFWPGAVPLSPPIVRAGLRFSSKGIAVPDSSSIALRAYELWDEAGRPEGRADEFWFQAEEEFRQLLEVDSDATGRDDGTPG
jgi:hypothetical protein